MGFPEPSGDVIVLGYFDGVHLGHIGLLETAAGIASRTGGRAVVRTFSDDRPDAISPGTLRRDLLLRFGAGDVVTDRFEDVRNMSPDEFVRYAVGPSDHVVCGFNYTFGRGRSGNPETLARLLSRGRLFVVPPVLCSGERVSSSLIRSLLSGGETARAVGMLGHPYIIRGEIIHGKHMGRSIGFPTANVALRGTVPPNGAYSGYCRVGGRLYPTVTGITSCPTTGGEKRHAETHIIGFDGDLYGLTLDFMITGRLRGEENFSNLGELSRQLAADIRSSEETFGNTDVFFSFDK